MGGLWGPRPGVRFAPGTAGSPTSQGVASSVGFDASEPLVDALQQGKIQGLVVQNPYQDGRARRQDAGQAPREESGRAQDLDRRDAGHAREHERAGDRQLSIRPRPRTSGASLVGRQDEEVAGDRDPQGDDARVLEDGPRRRAQGGRRAGQRRGDLAGAAEGGRPGAADPARPERGRRRRRRDRAGPARLAGAGRAGRGGGRQGDPGRHLRLGARVDEDRQLRRDRQLPRRRAGRPAAGRAPQGQGKVILLRYAVGSESTEQREKGFTDTLAKEFPGITYLRTPSTPGRPPTRRSRRRRAWSRATAARSTGSSARTSRAPSGCSGPWRGRACWRRRP